MGIIKDIRKGLADLLTPKPVQTSQQLEEYFKMLSGYTPVFSSFDGGLYEMELTRACIHSFATHASKLRPVVSGNDVLHRRLQTKPNPIQDTSKFLYQLATLLMVYNNVLIIPIEDRGKVVGYLPIPPDGVQIKERAGVLYVTYTSWDGVRGAIEYDRCGIVNQMQLRDPFFGEGNNALNTTLDLLHSQAEGIQEGIKNSASIRFIAKLAQVLKPEALKKERERFVEQNLGRDSGGVLMFDQKYTDIQQVRSEPFIVDAEQSKIIQESVFTYFGTSEAILQNKFSSADWNAYYEGKIEPFAVQVGLVLTNMSFTDREKAFGAEVFLTSNRMQYLSNDEKLRTVTELFDRGFLTHNQGLEIFNMPTIEGGDKHYIRLEYATKQEVDSNEQGIQSTESTNASADEQAD